MRALQLLFVYMALYLWLLMRRYFFFSNHGSLCIFLPTWMIVFFFIFGCLCSYFGLRSSFSYLGKLHLFLGLEVTHHDHGLTLTRMKSLDLFCRVVMMKCKTTTTCIPTTDNIMNIDGNLLSFEWFHGTSKYCWWFVVIDDYCFVYIFGCQLSLLVSSCVIRHPLVGHQVHITLCAPHGVLWSTSLG
jgi:hypothetical protein